MGYVYKLEDPDNGDEIVASGAGELEIIQSLVMELTGRDREDIEFDTYAEWFQVLEQTGPGGYVDQPSQKWFIEMGDIRECLEDTLQSYAPEGFYFGQHPAEDGSLGFWRNDENC